MKNRELFKEKMKLVGELFFRTIITYLIASVFYVVILDWFLGNYLGNSLYNINYEMYYWCVTNKSILFLIYILVIFIISLYTFFSKKVENFSAIYKSLDKILEEDNSNIELPTELFKFSEKLNHINRKYILSQRNAREAEQKKNDLIMYMAHDLKTPLTSVIGYLTLLNEEKEISEETRNKYTKIALDKSLRLEDLTNQFFEITRYNLNDMPINKNDIDISMLLDQLVDEFYPMLEEKKLKLLVNKPDTLIYSADGDKLARAFGNLIRNAISYSFENSDIEINVTQIDSKINLVFRNKGDKIPEYKLDKIFDKFYRIDESRTSSTGGTGLGLAITKEIVELHGGNIKVKNDDEYIEFYIELQK